jgi:diguanylate cyclase (GGDEF)-like protein/PAS domain S-box-containing protein
LPLLSSVRGRIITGFGLLVFILVAVVGGSAWLARVHRSDMDSMELHSDNANLLDDAAFDATLANLLLERYLTAGTESAVPVVHSSVAAVIEGLAEAQANAGDQQHAVDQATMDELAAGADALSATFEEVIVLQQSGDAEGARQTLEAATAEITAFGIRVGETAELERTEIPVLRSRVERTAALAFWLLVLSGVGGAVIALAASALIARSILKPLSSLESTALALADGDLEARSQAEGPRELAHLGASLNKMTESLLDASKRRELEEGLRESEERFRQFVDQAADAIFVADSQGRFTDANRAACESLGYTRQELLSLCIQDIARGLSPDAIAAAIEHVAGGASLTVEGAHLRKDGTTIPVEIRMGRIDIGGHDLMLAVARDISERKRAEEALRQRTHDLGERVKELGCLYSISRLVDQPGVSLKEILQGTADLIPASWQYPDVTCARITLDGQEFQTDNFNKAPWTQSANITVHGGRIGAVEVCYLEERPASDEGPFLEEERSLIDAIARQLGKVTERKRAEEALRESEEWLSTTLTSIGDAVIATDRVGRVTFLNPVAQSLTGWKREDAAGMPLTDVLNIVSERTGKSAENPVARVIREGAVIGLANDTVLIARNGTRRPIEDSAAPIRDSQGSIIGVVLVFHDVTERRRAEEELHRLNQQLEELNRSLETKVEERTQELDLANEELRERNRQLLDAHAQAATDGLTGLSNHRAFHERANHEVQLARTHENSLGLVILDIDNFKRVNDSRGHQEGDQVLREIAVALSDSVSAENAYRYGGDEFAVLLPGADLAEAAKVAERIRQVVGEPTTDDCTGVTVSLGITSFPDVAESVEELVYGADAAMYWAKSAGKNRIGDWSKLMRRRTDGKLPWYAADRAVRAPDVVASLVAALAAKDPLTAGHTERCSWYAARLAEELGLTEEETSVVRLASLLHDVGKLAVPDAVLFKPGPLNEEEWGEMKRHPTAALTILSHIRSITDAIPAILHHHEHFDGSGYPDGLAGEDIPMASRILLVTDAFDAMTTDRPYREAMLVEAAVEELKRNSGTQFDPGVVEAFLRILSREGARPLGRTASAQAKVAAAPPSGDGRGERPGP